MLLHQYSNSSNDLRSELPSFSRFLLFFSLSLFLSLARKEGNRIDSWNSRGDAFPLSVRLELTRPPQAEWRHEKNKLRELLDFGGRSVTSLSTRVPISRLATGRKARERERVESRWLAGWLARLFAEQISELASSNGVCSHDFLSVESKSESAGNLREKNRPRKSLEQI